MRTFYLFILLLINFELFATDSTKVKNLEEVNVTALRFQLKNSETATRITSISRKDIKSNNSRSMPEFFDGNGNFYLQKTNHGGGSVFLRGLTGNQTLLMIDGIRLNNSTFRYGPNQYLNTINSNMVASVEVLAGSGSVQYGSDAIGGLINIFSLSPDFDKKYSLDLSTRLGSHNMEKGFSGILNFSKNKFGIILSGSLRNFGDLLGGQGIQTPSGYKEHSFESKAVYKFSENSRLTAAFQNLVQTDVPIYHKIVLENFAINHIRNQARNLSYLKYSNTFNNRFFSSQDITLSRQFNPEERALQKNNSATLRTEKDLILTTGFSATNVSKFTENWQASTGFEWYADQVNSERNDDLNGKLTQLRGLYPDGSKYSNQSVFSLHQYKFKSAHFNAGLRWNTVNMEIPDEKLGLSKVQNSALVYNLGWIQNFRNGLAPYVSYNTAFRAPNVDDMGTLGIVDFRYEIPSDDLRPEKSKQFELGLKFQSKNNFMQLNVFQNQLVDLITREKIVGQVIETYQVYEKMNTGKAIIKGIEWSSKSKLSESLKLETYLTYTYGQDLIKNQPLRRMPPLFANFNLEYRYKAFKIKPIVNFATDQKRLAQGDIDDNRIGKNGTPGYTLYHVNFGYESKYVSLQLNVLNLGNKTYKTHGSGIYGYGRSAFLTIDFKI